VELALKVYKAAKAFRVELALKAQPGRALL
jgi:hypothetical protein